MLLVYKKPLKLLNLPFWMANGRSYMKSKIADHVIPDPGILPYRTDLLEFLKEQQLSGSKIVLASAADERIVQAVADELKIFESYHGSSRDTNLRGSVKAVLLDEEYEDYDYVGDSKHDIAVWNSSKKKYLAGNNLNVRNKFEYERVFDTEKSMVKSAIKLIRPHQWLKNFLIFIPMLLAFKIDNWSFWSNAFLAFLCFSLMASLVYVINDCLDIENDRRHPKKCKRPLASGQLTIKSAIFIAILLLFFSVIPAITLADSLTLFYMLVGYFTLTSLYTFCFKKMVILDVLILAGLFTYRIVTGGVVLGIEVTPWLLAFSMFLFSSLAMAKRWIDLIDLQSSGKLESSGRGYQVDDRSVLLHMGSASAMCTVLVFSLFINEKCNETPLTYMHPNFLWLLCPLLMYWLMRIWFLASRGHVHEDPVMFAAKDRATYVVAIVCIFLVIYAKGDLL